MHRVELPAAIGCCLMATIGVGDSSTAVDEPAKKNEIAKSIFDNNANKKLTASRLYLEHRGDAKGICAVCSPRLPKP
jgi:hypothetical protein